MSDMVERAARALAQEIGEPIVSHATIRKDWATMTDTEHKALRFGARDALLAALDPADHALVEGAARAVTRDYGKDKDGVPEGPTLDAYVEQNWDMFAESCISTIAFLRSQTAQGVSVP